MSATIITQVVRNQWSILHNRVTALVFAVKRTKWINLRTLKTVLTHLILVIKNELLDLLAICWTALRVTHGVNHELHISWRETHLLVKLHQHDDGLCIGSWIRGSKPLNTYLVELAQATLLRALSPEH